MLNHNGVNSGGPILGFKFVRVTLFCVDLKLLFFCLFYRVFVLGMFFYFSFGFTFHSGCSFPRFVISLKFILVHGIRTCILGMQKLRLQ